MQVTQDLLEGAEVLRVFGSVGRTDLARGDALPACGEELGLDRGEGLRGLAPEERVCAIFDLDERSPRARSRLVEVKMPESPMSTRRCRPRKR